MGRFDWWITIDPLLLLRDRLRNYPEERQRYADAKSEVIESIPARTNV